MAFNVFQNSQQGAAFVICVVTIPLCTIAIILRFISTRRARQKIGYEDIFALLALLFHLLYTTIFLYLLSRLNGQVYIEIGAVSPSKLIHILKVGWFTSAQYTGNQLFTKLSLLVFYHRLFSINRTFDRWLQFLGILQIAWFVPVYLVKYFFCLPVESIWNLSVPGKCINIGAFLAATESINSLIDFAMIILAVWIVNSLQMSNHAKWKLGMLFALGGLSGIIGLIKIKEAYSAAYNNFLSPIWDIVQMSTSIICCCAPIYKPLISDLKILKTLKATFSSSDSQSKSRNFSTSGRSWATDSNRYETGDEAWLRLEERGHGRGADRFE
ncbi:Uu.00g134690.m01.CDS01 [Anthostomella pinea]|uniref:Uu.00g134690.m01.CDS01 n=1 Tax=Anthostomella pinea TaxID=933095 RepID=A0AAI8VPR0_9PEZI|nr:Uu.00g134690.m01.CDS01 [Anthostomella pinea]